MKPDNQEQRVKIKELFSKNLCVYEENLPHIDTSHFSEILLKKIGIITEFDSEFCKNLLFRMAENKNSDWEKFSHYLSILQKDKSFCLNEEETKKPIFYLSNNLKKASRGFDFVSVDKILIFEKKSLKKLKIFENEKFFDEILKKITKYGNFYPISKFSNKEFLPYTNVLKVIFFF